jgi:hypothetical protein
LASDEEASKQSWEQALDEIIGEISGDAPADGDLQELWEFFHGRYPSGKGLREALKKYLDEHSLQLPDPSELRKSPTDQA